MTAPAQAVLDSGVLTPAYVYDEKAISSNLGALKTLGSRAGLCTLYSLKAASNAKLLELITSTVDGFSASSVFEVRLGREFATSDQRIHLTSPLVSRAEIQELAECRGMVSFNSFEQARRLAPYGRGRVRLGLRLNPGVSLVEDRRYDPSRRQSKLGVPLAEVRIALDERDPLLLDIEGIHFHTNCEARSFKGVLTTVRHLISSVPELLEQAKWANIGGGYLFATASDVEELFLAVDLLKSKGPCEVYFEPGAGVVQEAGYLVTRVVDLFRRDGIDIAVLDTTVSHWPEVFEYQFQPYLFGDDEENEFEYLLAGCTCLAGDIFGKYSLGTPLEVGSKLVFTGAGAYSLVKANYFNGINLPNIYWMTNDGEITLAKGFTFEDFLVRNGARNHVSV